jgi:hypothetical protein
VLWFAQLLGDTTGVTDTQKCRNQVRLQRSNYALLTVAGMSAEAAAVPHLRQSP